MGLHFVAQHFTSFGLGLNFGFLALTSINCIFFPASSTSASYFKCTTITETTKNLSERILFTDGSDVVGGWLPSPVLSLGFWTWSQTCSHLCKRSFLLPNLATLISGLYENASINNLIDLQDVKTSNGYNKSSFSKKWNCKEARKKTSQLCSGFSQVEINIKEQRFSEWHRSCLSSLSMVI